MEEAQNAFSSENEAKGMDVHLGVEGSNSNGHGEEIDKEGNMMKIIERLQKDVQTHRADNKKLMKAREQQGEFNIKLIQSLERIENKLDKGSDSSKSGSHGSPDERGNQGVLADTIITPKGTLRGGNTVVQAHLLSESIGDLEWMN
jgi:acetyl-CoA carboxylase carboxyltransferase component